MVRGCDCVRMSPEPWIIKLQSRGLAYAFRCVSIRCPSLRQQGGQILATSKDGMFTFDGWLQHHVLVIVVFK